MNPLQINLKGCSLTNFSFPNFGGCKRVNCLRPRSNAVAFWRMLAGVFRGRLNAHIIFHSNGIRARKRVESVSNLDRVVFESKPFFVVTRWQRVGRAFEVYQPLRAGVHATRCMTPSFLLPHLNPSACKPACKLSRACQSEGLSELQDMEHRYDG